MYYRPQMAFQTPRGFRDEDFVYSFDATTNPILGTAIAAGQMVNDVVLQTQNDVEFILRGWKVERAALPSTLTFQVKNAFGVLLSACFIPLATYLSGSGAPIAGLLPVPMEDEIRIPSSGFLQVYFLNQTAAPVTPPRITLFGVKRYAACEVKA